MDRCPRATRSTSRSSTGAPSGSATIRTASPPDSLAEPNSGVQSVRPGSAGRMPAGRWPSTPPWPSPCAGRIQREPQHRRVLAIREAVIQAGFQHDIDWSQSVGTPATPEVLAQEAILVICISGMRHTVAQQIYRRVMHAMRVGVDPREVFRHPGKSQAIAGIWRRRSEQLTEFRAAVDKVAWYGGTPLGWTDHQVAPGQEPRSRLRQPRPLAGSPGRCPGRPSMRSAGAARGHRRSHRHRRLRPLCGTGTI